MKFVYTHTIIILTFLVSKSASGQGRVVINEFMAWSGCNTTSEFIELMNFGPGPMNIGCYIVTNGKYSVTIPPNTILQPRQYYILSGQEILADDCGNVDSAITVDLNWNTCNCTNLPIPTTGDGFLQNGGGANEKVILLDPNLNVIDAVSRDVPVSSSDMITTPSLNGNCNSYSFDLDNMSISYEWINNSTGINNSFARKVDGDCGWVKTTAISADAPNKTGSTSSATYNFSTLSASECGGTTGSISIQVSAADVNSLFPMNYTLGFDSDGNDVFNSNDQYFYGTDNSAPSIDISGLPYGRYRITVGSNSSCNLKSYDFYIFNCYGVVLPVKLHYFNYYGTVDNRNIFKFKVDEHSTLSHIVLEGGTGGTYQPVASLYGPFIENEMTIAASNSPFSYFRLKITNQAGQVSYSREVNIRNLHNDARFWPNPVKEKIFISLNPVSQGTLVYQIINSVGSLIKKGEVRVHDGVQTITIPVGDLEKGVYYFNINGEILPHKSSFKFVK